MRMELLMGKDNMFGKMVQDTRDNLFKAKGMEMESGETAKVIIMRDYLKMIKKMVLEFLSGQMVINIKANL